MNFKILLSTSFIVSSVATFAQQAGKTFAITGDGTGDFRWMNIRQVDIASGKVLQDIFKRDKTAFVLMDAATKKPVINISSGSINFPNPVPTETMVAAAAYDKKHDKLFFTPMQIGELRWLDVSAKEDAPKFYIEKTQLLNTLDLMDEANHITRMDIAADGNGYAVTNDGNHLIRFTTGKKTVVTDLGNLVDAESNKNGISIHNKCTSWGGDMIADAYGKLYIISANRQIFKVDIDTRITTHIGTITGLPDNYTTNGAAVDADGNVVVSSAIAFEGYFKFSMDNLVAAKIEGSDKIYNASDLANGYLLYQKEADAKKNFGVSFFKPVTQLNNDAKVYPNPVTANEFKVLFDGQNSGQYTITLTDLSGRTVMVKQVLVSLKLQTLSVQLTRTVAKGIYLVKVTDTANKVVFIERIAVQ
jgi:lipocalin